MKAWHFVGEKLRNGEPVPPDGKWLRWNGPLEMCKTGLHASVEPFDALRYAPGPVLCLVEVSGEIVKGNDKLVCSQRKIICRMDATEMLRYFARMQALSVIHLYPNGTDDVVFDYLMTGDEALRAAAWDASCAAIASGAAAWDASWSTIESGDAARAAARASALAEIASGYADTTWAAARAASWSTIASGAATWDAARRDFNELVYECFDYKP